MEFLNRKEQVIEFVLTKYGEQLLSQGNLKPEYYAFFDDDILYDTVFASFFENSGSQGSQERIKETPRIRQQSSLAVETYFKKNLGDQSHLDRNELLPESIGNGSGRTDKYPAIDINFLKGELSGSVEYITGSFSLTQIPQLSSSIEYKVAIGIHEDQFLEENVKLYSDNSFIQVYENSIILKCEELNSIFEKENFDIEVFKVEDVINRGIIGTVDTREELIPLKFVKTNSNIVNGILLDLNEEPRIVSGELTSENVEYYMEILVDEEIDPNDLCEVISENKVKNIYLDRTTNCKNVDDRRKDMYQSEIDFEEGCDE